VSGAGLFLEGGCFILTSAAGMAAKSRKDHKIKEMNAVGAPGHDSSTVEGVPGYNHMEKNQNGGRGLDGGFSGPTPGVRGALWEGALVALLLAGFLAINLPSIERYPCVWIDEVSYADPGIHLATGWGWRSLAWYAQDSAEFWAGNVPAHPLLVAAVVKVFGLSIASVRSVNYILMIGTTLLLWLAVRRSGWIRTPWARMLLLALAWTGYSLVFSYRSSRPDVITMLVAAAGLACFTGVERRGRWIGLFLAAFVAPWTGLQLLPFIAAAGLVLLLVLRRAGLGPMLSLALGSALGLATLLLFYRSQGVLDDFLRSTAGHSAGILQQLLSGHFSHHNLLPKDFSFAILTAGALGMVLLDGLRRRPQSRVLLTTLLFAGTVAVVLVLSGKFPTYYGWMTFIPMAIGVCAWIEARLAPCPEPATGAPTFLSAVVGWCSRRADRNVRAPAAGLMKGWIERAWGASVCLASVLVGAGLHTAAAVYNWAERDYAIVRDVVERGVRKDDVVYAYSSAYYALLGRNEVYTDCYLWGMSVEDKSRITCLVLQPRDAAYVLDLMGGKFEPTEVKFVPSRPGFLGLPLELGFLTRLDYHLQVYRRVSVP
jgi:hypothetical protein